MTLMQQVELNFNSFSTSFSPSSSFFSKNSYQRAEHSEIPHAPIKRLSILSLEEKKVFI
jgi:hypothetical protein